MTNAPSDRPDAQDTRIDVSDVMRQLDELEQTVDSSNERRDVRRIKTMLHVIPGRKTIRKYTGRDVAEGFVGGIVFSLPLLVEDGVFEIAEWFASWWVGPIPIMLVANVLFITVIVAGLLYYTDFREIKEHPILGFIPRRLVALLVISLVVAAGSMFLWGRLHEEDPTQLEQVGRITVIWAAAALGATLGDMLPGESTGRDLQSAFSEDGKE